MKTIKILSTKHIFSAGVALLMFTSMNYVFAEEGNVTQTGSQERARNELNPSLPGSGFAQSRNREEHTERYQNQNQNRQQNQYKYTNQYRNGDNNSASGSENRVNTTNHYMQGNAATGSMSRQNTASPDIS